MGSSIWYRLGYYLKSTHKDVVILSYDQILDITGSRAIQTIYNHPEFFADHDRPIFMSIKEAGYTWENDFNNSKVTFIKDDNLDNISLSIKGLGNIVKVKFDYYPIFKGDEGTNEINICITPKMAYYRKKLYKNDYDNKTVLHKDKVWGGNIEKREYNALIKALEKPFKPYYNSSQSIGKTVITIFDKNNYSKSVEYHVNFCDMPFGQLVDILTRILDGLEIPEFLKPRL